jgi:murein DD-endopeptidase MepM/ murein hydrolase activator NlpD
LAADHQHHKSKKRSYTIVLVPDEDASKSKNFRLVAWQLALGLSLFIVLTFAFVLVTLTYTPAGRLFPLSNTGLEEKYNKELVALNQRMTGLMEQLVELRTYNVKLRHVLGEKVASSDSGAVNVPLQTIKTERERPSSDERIISKSPQQIFPEPQMVPIRVVKREDNRAEISFPAILPTDGYVTRGFEPDNNHFGLDIAGKTGTLVVAAADGYIVFAGWTYDEGYILIISHSGGFVSLYKHNQSLLKSAGSSVRRGEPIATLGDSGVTSSGPHLHFEIRKDGVPVDPSVYLINFYL